MSSLIQFYLKRKLWNAKVMYRYILVFMILGFVIYADVIVGLLQQFNQVQVKIDESAVEYMSYFKDDAIVDYITEGNGFYTLVYEDHWKLYARESVDDHVIQTIRNSIENIPGFSSNEKYELSIIHSRVRDDAMVLIVYTLVYFLFLSKSISIVQELIVEKLSGMTELLLSGISAMKHLIAKIIVSWFSIGINGVVSMAMSVVWLMIRFGVFSQYQIQQWLEQWLILDYIDFNLGIIVIGVIALLLNMLSAQVLVIMYMSKAKTMEEASHMIIWAHMIPIVLYYISFYLYGIGIFDIAIGNSVMYIPILQTIMLPLHLCLEKKITLHFVIGILLSVMYLVVVLKYGNHIYRNRVLNIEKVTKSFKIS